jgi:hypothetical protein
MHAAASSAGPQLQLHLALFTDHEIKAWLHEEERRSQRKSHRRVRPLHSFRFTDDGRSLLLFEELSPLELTAPLNGVFDPDNELNCDTDPLQSGEEDDEREEEPESWSDAGVAQLHEAVLHHSLRALQARGNGVEKAEILKWIFAPDRMTTRALDAQGHLREVSVPQVFVPFSFERCCRICGYCPERMRDELIPVLKGIGLGYVFNEISNGNTTSNSASCGADTEDEAVQAARHVQPA